MVEYCSAAVYINSVSSLKEKIQRIDEVIMSLLEAAATAAENQSILGYSLDDGQTKINTQYRSSAEAFNAIKNFEDLRARYESMLDTRINGRVFRMVDGKNFTSRKTRRFK